MSVCVFLSPALINKDGVAGRPGYLDLHHIMILTLLDTAVCVTHSGGGEGSERIPSSTGSRRVLFEVVLRRCRSSSLVVV